MLLTPNLAIKFPPKLVNKATPTTTSSRDLKKLTDQKLIESTDSLVAKEREILISVLEHLREIERRRLFSALGFSSLWDYAVKRLKYSEDQAQRRISAVRLLKELPEIEEKIESGALTLTNLGLAHSLFRQESKRPDTQGLNRIEKLEVLSELEHKSKREAEKIVLQQSSQPAVLRPDRVKLLTDTHVLVQFTADPSLLEKIERLKGLLAHSHPDLSMAELIGRLCDLGLEKWDPLSKREAKLQREAKFSIRRNEKNTQTVPPAPAQELTPGDSRKSASKLRRPYISAALRQEIWHRAAGQCTKCGSQRKLEIEHKHPVAMGGGNDSENLTLLCRPCNQRTAIERFGLPKMAAHINGV